MWFFFASPRKLLMIVLNGLQKANLQWFESGKSDILKPESVPRAKTASAHPPDKSTDFRLSCLPFVRLYGAPAVVALTLIQPCQQCLIYTSISPILIVMIAFHEKGCAMNQETEKHHVLTFPLFKCSKQRCANKQLSSFFLSFFPFRSIHRLVGSSKLNSVVEHP